MFLERLHLVETFLRSMFANLVETVLKPVLKKFLQTERFMHV